MRLHGQIQLAGSPEIPLASPVVKARRERVVWLDFFRGAAVLVMIETHVVNTFLASAMRVESWFTVLNYVNGLVAPSFLFIAGFVQGMERASNPGKAINYGRRGRRLLGLLLLGYALHFPWTELAQHRWDDAVRVGTQVDVLQCIAAALGLVLLVGGGADWIRANALKGSQDDQKQTGAWREFLLGDGMWWLGVTALLSCAVFAAPATAVSRNLPIPLEAWINASTSSWFPLFPWVGFVFAGALAGAASGIGRVVEDRTAGKARAALSILPNPANLFGARSAVLLVTPLPLALAAWASRDAHYSNVSPASFLERTAWVFVLAAVCEWWAARRRLPKLVLFAGQHSLTLYVMHLVLISTLVGNGVPAGKFMSGVVLGMILVVSAVSLCLTGLYGWAWSAMTSWPLFARTPSKASR